jgi:hypothetical protein
LSRVGHCVILSRSARSRLYLVFWTRVRHRVILSRVGHRVILSRSAKKSTVFGIGIELAFELVFGRMSTLSTGVGNGIGIGIGSMSALLSTQRHQKYSGQWTRISVVMVEYA